jgi:hypothetical protein
MDGMTNGEGRLNLLGSKYPPLLHYYWDWDLAMSLIGPRLLHKAFCPVLPFAD